MSKVDTTKQAPGKVNGFNMLEQTLVVMTVIVVAFIAWRVFGAADGTDIGPREIPKQPPVITEMRDLQLVEEYLDPEAIDRHLDTNAIDSLTSDL